MDTSIQQMFLDSINDRLISVGKTQKILSRQKYYFLLPYLMCVVTLIHLIAL